MTRSVTSAKREEAAYRASRRTRLVEQASPASRNSCGERLIYEFQFEIADLRAIFERSSAVPAHYVIEEEVEITDLG